MSSYFSYPVAQSLYGATNDMPGYPDPIGTEPIRARPCPDLKYGSEICAQHVFGDFSYLFQLVQTKIPWAEAGENTNSALPTFLAWSLFHLTHSYWISLCIYFAITLVFFLYPIIKISKLLDHRVSFVVLLISCWSFVYVFDRGNTVGLIFTPLWMTYEGFRSNSNPKSVIGLTLCLLIRIHLVLLLIPFLVHRRFRTVGASLFASISLNLILLRVMTPYVWQNLQGFLGDLVGIAKLGESGPAWPDYYRNISLGGFVGSVIETTQNAIGKPHVIEVLIQDWWSPLLPAIIGLAVALPLACRRRAPNWTIFAGAVLPFLLSSPRAHGYSAIVIVHLFLIVVNEGVEVSFRDHRSKNNFLLAFLVCQSQSFYIPMPVDPRVGQPIGMKSFSVPIALFILLFTAYRCRPKISSQVDDSSPAR